MKVGLVLEGGAMRGMYTAGVLDTFIDNNIDINEIVGVSAGALFGVNYVSKQKERTIRYNKRFNKDKNYIGLKPLLKEGNIVNTKYAYEDVPYKLDPFDNETFKQSNKNFYATVTNVDNGEAEYILIDDGYKQMDYLRASGSMPFVSKIVNINDKRYLDGGISDSIPYKFLLDNGCDKIIVILTRDINYRKSKMSPLLINMFYKKYPYLKEKLLNRHNVYNKSVEDLKILEEKNIALVIRPSLPIEIGRIEKNEDRLQEVYDLGKEDTLRKIDEIRDFICA